MDRRVDSSLPLRHRSNYCHAWKRSTLIYFAQKASPTLACDYSTHKLPWLLMWHLAGAACHWSWMPPNKSNHSAMCYKHGSISGSDSRAVTNHDLRLAVNCSISAAHGAKLASRRQLLQTLRLMTTQSAKKCLYLVKQLRFMTTNRLQMHTTWCWQWKWWQR